MNGEPTPSNGGPEIEAHTPIRCPWCEAARVERVAVVGSHLMVSQYICLECRCPFEVIRR